ncbi:SGNH/GDSL hydrolase family protein [Pseudarthrobacter sp. C4D7]|nr:SGNH/GDSL hydrolase family protein [Pseudarthrobacter sp. C4D7]
MSLLQTPEPAAAPGFDASAAASRMAADRAAFEAKQKAEVENTFLPVTFPKDHPLRVLYVGDSLGNGYAATSDAQFFRNIATEKLKAYGPVEATFAGRPSLTAEAALAEYRDKISAEYDLVVMEIGTNDWSKVPVPTFTETYPALIKAVRAASPNAALLCLGAWGDGIKVGPFNMVIQPTCQAAGGKYRDLNAVFAPSGNKWINGVRDNGTKVDTFHPNDKGHAAIADVILAALRIS